MNKRKYIIPNVQFVYMTMTKNVCQNPDTGSPDVIGSFSTKGKSDVTDDYNAPARIKLYF